MAGKKNIYNVLFIGLSLTTIIPVLVVIYLVKPELFYGVKSVNVFSLIIVITLFIVYLGVRLLLDISNSIAKISRNAEVIAQGNLAAETEVRPMVKNNSEVATLAESLNLITEQLIFNVDELESRAILLERANRELEKASKKKTEFVSTVSHELRAPLINIKHSVELLKNKQEENITPAQAEAMEIVSRNIERLIHMVGDLLDVSAIDSGQLRLEKKTVVLNKVIQEAINTIDKWRENKGINIELKLSQVIPDIHIDEEKIVQVLTNILSNAIKVVPPRGKIKISLNLIEMKPEQAGTETKETGLKKRFAEIAIADNGPGIAEEDLEKIFERFTKVNKLSQANYMYSTGLGLSIAREIVHLHNGQIKVKSELNKGSTFIVLLPLSGNGGDSNNSKERN